MQLTQELIQYIEDHQQEAYELLLELAQIPSPSNHEEKRAEFCKAWLEKNGAEGVYIDEALNVIYPVGCTEENPLVVFAAHIDVVFPDTESLPLKVENGRICCPGVGDDTTNVVALLMIARYIAQNKLTPKDGGMLLVFDAGEEGLGDLKGTRRLVDVFGHRMKEFISLDCTSVMLVPSAVGSHRYRVSIDTEGGHSFANFGNRNAIAYLASLIDTLYSMKVPEYGHTTYNVGTISGGTSVNTIAQHAEMLYEYRSDDVRSLDLMKKHFEAAIEFYRTKGIAVTVEKVGDRPCSMGVPEEAQKALIARSVATLKRHTGKDVVLMENSTDCNIPLSRGIPSVAFGCYEGEGAHTREEYVEIDSLLPGLKIGFEAVLYYF